MYLQDLQILLGQDCNRKRFTEKVGQKKLFLFYFEVNATNLLTHNKFKIFGTEYLEQWKGKRKQELVGLKRKSDFSQYYSFCTFLDKMHYIATAVRKAAERENNMRHGKNMFLI